MAGRTPRLSGAVTYPAAGSSAGFVVLVAVPARVVARRGLDQVGDGLPGLRAELEDGAELGAADAGVPDQGQQLDLLLQQSGLFGVVVEEESRRDAERPGQSLDQPFLRVLRLAVPQLPDRRVADLFAGDVLDQGGDLVIGERAAAGRMRPVDQPVYLVRQGAKRGRACLSCRDVIRHHRTSLLRTGHHLISNLGSMASYSS